MKTSFRHFLTDSERSAFKMHAKNRRYYRALGLNDSRINRVSFDCAENAMIDLLNVARSRRISPPMQSNEFTMEQLQQAYSYWRAGLTDADLLFYWEHYTTGTGKGMY